MRRRPGLEAVIRAAFILALVIGVIVAWSRGMGWLCVILAGLAAWQTFQAQNAWKCHIGFF